MDVPDDDIFGDLLKGNTPPMRTSPYYLGPSHNYPSEDGFHLSIQPQFALNSSLLYNESSITSFLNSKNLTSLAYSQDDKFCYVLIDKDTFISIQVYHLPPDHTTSSHPVLYHSFNTSLRSSLFQDDDDGEEKTYRSLYTLHQKASLTDCQHRSWTDLESKCSGNIGLPQSLFVYLFDQQTACLNSAVLLLCCRNGDMFTYTIQSANYGKLQLFCSLSVPVVGVLPAVTLVKVETSGDEDLKARNKILNSIRTSLQSRLSSANVMKDGSMDGLLVVGRSGTCVKTCKLVLCKTEKQFSISHKSHLILDQAKIQDLQLQNVEDKQEWHLFGITSDHDVLTIAVLDKSSLGGFPDSDSLEEAKLDCQEKPACLKDALHRLNVHSETMKALQKKSLQLDSVLLQMNLFATISQQQNISRLKQQSNNLKDYAESCEVLECGCELVLSKERHMAWELRIKLTNKSSVSFSDKWSVIVTENPVFSSSLSYHLNLPMANSFQFRLDSGLESRSDIEFTAPVVDSFLFDYLLELQVSVILILCLESVHEERPADTGVRKGKSHLLQVEVCRQSFDILTFLEKSSSIHQNKKYFQQENTETGYWLANQLYRMGESRIGGFHLEPVSLETEKSLFSVSVDLPLGFSDSRTDILLSFLNSRTHLRNETNCSFTTPGLQTLHISVDVWDDKDPPLWVDTRGRYCLNLKSQDVLMMFSVLEVVRQKIRSRMAKDRNTISKERLENALKRLKRVRHLLRDNFNVLRFGSDFHSDYMTSFCYFLENLRSVNTLDLVNW